MEGSMSKGEGNGNRDGGKIDTNALMALQLAKGNESNKSIPGTNLPNEAETKTVKIGGEKTFGQGDKLASRIVS